MLPTLELGDRFTVLKAGTPSVGDIVVLRPPAGAEDGRCDQQPPPAGQMCAKPTPEAPDVRLVERVVAVAGDRIALRGGRLIRNGRPERTEGPRACGGPACDFPREITIPEGHLFVLGDNRGASDDSRFWGPVPEDWIVGQLWFVYA